MMSSSTKTKTISNITESFKEKSMYTIYNNLNFWGDTGQLIKFKNIMHRYEMCGGGEGD